MSDELKTKINWSCKFNNRPYQIIEGHLRIVEHTNLAYVEPHKVIIGDTLYLFFNEQKHFLDGGCILPGSIQGFFRNTKRFRGYAEKRKKDGNQGEKEQNDRRLQRKFPFHKNTEVVPEQDDRKHLQEYRENKRNTVAHCLPDRKILNIAEPYAQRPEPD